MVSAAERAGLAIPFAALAIFAKPQMYIIRNVGLLQVSI
jgi:hypothetical protein